MAKYTKTFTSDGLERYELEFRGKSYSYKMIPTEFGKKGDKPCFDTQIENDFNDLSEDVLEALENLSFSNDDEINELLEIISESE